MGSGWLRKAVVVDHAGVGSQAGSGDPQAPTMVAVRPLSPVGSLFCLDDNSEAVAVSVPVLQTGIVKMVGLIVKITCQGTIRNQAHLYCVVCCVTEEFSLKSRVCVSAHTHKHKCTQSTRGGHQASCSIALGLETVSLTMELGWNSKPFVLPLLLPAPGSQAHVLPS